ncbi:Phosphate import ATP-binding protein PstB [Sporomusa acidovorans DSM 3132]|uniref:Phosphate import ATP-binding protein PstB n=1 Tax=Sporomusa acidovorans (strain ATCC 49682 / DSM 3132 / Mol) TaxID=1123286 RepID=A0ABZ3JB20_SPOA4|nr:phosphate import ATP-binding protein PstB [Sporomusa acidovorans DSM 3132]SDD96272.1 putative ABC transport system ATP-binding protein [Sporomusa acidovorans]
MFIVENLRYKRILEIVSLTISRPISCIMGPSGSGKTTLLRMLNRLNAPDEGRILYNGQDIALMDTIKLRRNVVMLGQMPVIYSGTVADNLQIGLQFSQRPPASDEDLRKSLAWVELDKELADSCHNFSGGEKQRLCLARIMLMDADTYLLDEPSAALDKNTERFIIEHLTEFVLRKNKQMVMVTHSEQIAQSFPQTIIRMEGGRVTEAYHE